jgi:hypothetical protein
MHVRLCQLAPPNMIMSISESVSWRLPGVSANHDTVALRGASGEADVSDGAGAAAGAAACGCGTAPAPACSCVSSACASDAGRALIRRPSGAMRGGNKMPGTLLLLLSGPPAAGAPAGAAAEADGSGCFAGCGAAGPAGCGATAGLLSSTVATSWPGTTVSSACTRMPSNRPSDGLLICVQQKHKINRIHIAVLPPRAPPIQL